LKLKEWRKRLTCWFEQALETVIHQNPDLWSNSLEQFSSSQAIDMSCIGNFFGHHCAILTTM
jgi:hypothetical protein